jgi:methionine synthase I (cobalamin-dependent)
MQQSGNIIQKKNSVAIIGGCCSAPGTNRA